MRSQFTGTGPSIKERPPVSETSVVVPARIP